MSRSILYAAIAALSLSGAIGCNSEVKEPTVVDAPSDSIVDAPVVADSTPTNSPEVDEAASPQEATPDVAETDESIGELPAYQAGVAGVSGRIKSVGSNTMSNMMTLWLEGFRHYYPNVEVELEGKGSGTAIPALVEGAANFGPMSRNLKESEKSEFRAKFGYDPTSLPTSIDTLAVFVHKDNPIKGMSFEQLDAIFSSTRKRGGAAIRVWGDLGLTGEWAKQPISVYGRDAASGTYEYFKEHVLSGGDFKNSVKEQAGSTAVVQAAASDLYGIGYSGIGFKTADVRVVPLAAENGDDFVPATPANAYSGEYPLARFLWLTVNYKPDSQLDPLNREFIKFVFSKEGQDVVKQDGCLPIPPRVAQESLESVGISSE